MWQTLWSSVQSDNCGVSVGDLATHRMVERNLICELVAPEAIRSYWKFWREEESAKTEIYFIKRVGMCTTTV